MPWEHEERTAIVGLIQCPVQRTRPTIISDSDVLSVPCGQKLSGHEQ